MFQVICLKLQEMKQVVKWVYFGYDEVMLALIEGKIELKTERFVVVDAGGVASVSHQVVMYDKEGKKLGVIGGRGAKEGKFNLPTHAAVGNDGTLYLIRYICLSLHP